MHFKIPRFEPGKLDKLVHIGANFDNCAVLKPGLHVLRLSAKQIYKVLS
jgi:hypothetical protein